MLHIAMLLAMTVPYDLRRAIGTSHTIWLGRDRSE
jgi:hypothetical protein